MRQQIIGATHKQTEIERRQWASHHLEAKISGGRLFIAPQPPDGSSPSRTDPATSCTKQKNMIHHPYPEGERHYQCIVCTYTGCTYYWLFYVHVRARTTDNPEYNTVFFLVLLFALRVICYLLFGCGACVTPFFPHSLYKRHFNSW